MLLAVSWADVAVLCQTEAVTLHCITIRFSMETYHQHGKIDEGEAERKAWRMKAVELCSLWSAAFCYRKVTENFMAKYIEVLRTSFYFTWRAGILIETTGMNTGCHAFSVQPIL